MGQSDKNDWCARQQSPRTVIGRESASFTGACALPVLMPLCWFLAASFSGGFCCARAESRSSVKQMALQQRCAEKGTQIGSIARIASGPKWVL